MEKYYVLIEIIVAIQNLYQFNTSKKAQTMLGKDV